MQADHRATGHLDDERLAAFVDGALEGDERAAAELHLAACDVCRVAVAEIVRTVEGLDAEAGAGGPELAVDAGSGVVPRPTARRNWLYGAAGLAAAAALALAVWLPRGERPELRELVQAVGANRPFLPRLTGGFAYGEVRVTRSGTEARRDPDVRIAVAQLEKRRRDRGDAASAAAFGVGALVVGDLETSIRELEAAVAQSPEDPRYLNDLAAARLVQADSDPEARLEHVAAAMESLARALMHDPDRPEALFNKALALELIGPRSSAVAAWDEYLAVERDAAWAGAARERKRRLDSAPDAAPGPTSRTCHPAECLRVLEERWFGAWADGQPRRIVDEPMQLAQALVARGGDRFGMQAMVEWDRAGADAALRGGWKTLLDARQAYARDDLDLAYARATSALAAFARIRSAASAAAEVQLATIAYRRRHLDEAHRRLGHALDESRRQGFRLLATRCEWLLGMIAWQQLRPGEALARTELAHRSLVELGDVAQASRILRVRADYLRLLGLRRDAWRLLTRAARDSRDIPHALTRYLLYFEASQFAEHGGLPFAAEWLQALAVGAARETGLTAAVVEARIRSARLRGQIGQRDAARRDLQEVAALLEQEPDEYLRASADYAYGTLSAGADAVPALSRAIAAHRRLEPAEVPFLLGARARAYRATGDLAAAEQDLADAMGHAERWSAHVPNRAERIQAFDEFFPVYAEAADLAVVARHDPAEGLRLIERFRSRALREALGIQSDRSLERLRQSLPPDTAAVVAASLPRRLVVWTVTRRGIEWQEHAASRQRVRTTVDHLLERIDKGAITSADTATLARWLVDPATRIGARSVVFVPDDVLARVPYAVLAAERTPNAPIHVVQSPSLSLWARAAGGYARDVPASASVLAVINPQATAGAIRARPDLPMADSDISLLPSAAVTTLRGREATAAAILRNLPSHDVFHFSGHAVGTFRHAGVSGLVVPGPDGGETLLTAAELSSVSTTRLRLAVLAGCSTSAGPVSTSEGPQSVAWGLLAAGVPAVVATLWDVDDFSTSVFMRAFYRELRTKGPAAALRSAQQSMRSSSDSRLRAPAAWGGFVLLGATTPPQGAPHDES